MKTKVLAFDLDDTLIDTSGEIVPTATSAAYEAMKEKGLSVEFETFENARRKGALSISHKMIFRQLAEKYGPPNKIEESTEAGIHSFYNPKLPKTLSLLPGAQENLEHLKSKYPLFLVTSGSLETQKEKVKRSGLERFFNEIYFIEGVRLKRKSEAFELILRKTSCHPRELLAIGNRLSQEIHDAKILGCQTCYFQYGEHVGEVSKNQFEIPDFTILQHSELLEKCQL